MIDTGGLQYNNAKVDIKEFYRSVKESLPWKLPETHNKDLVAYAVMRINTCRTTAIDLYVCPKVLFILASRSIIRRNSIWNLGHML
jgi:hypothetical protein